MSRRLSGCAARRLVSCKKAKQLLITLYLHVSILLMDNSWHLKQCMAAAAAEDHAKLLWDSSRAVCTTAASFALPALQRCCQHNSKAAQHNSCSPGLLRAPLFATRKAMEAAQHSSSATEYT